MKLIVSTGIWVVLLILLIVSAGQINSSSPQLYVFLVIFIGSGIVGVMMWWEILSSRFLGSEIKVEAVPIKPQKVNESTRYRVSVTKSKSKLNIFDNAIETNEQILNMPMLLDAREDVIDLAMEITGRPKSQLKIFSSEGKIEIYGRLTQLSHGKGI